MTVHDLWQGFTKAEVAEARKKNLDRYQRRWREGVGRQAKQRKEGYKEHQRAQSYLDDANHMQKPEAQRIRRSSVTVNTLLDRHLAAKAGKAPRTVESNIRHAHHVREAFGDNVVSALDHTKIEVWSIRPGVAAESRKKQVEILRAAIKRGIRDKIVDTDPTEDIVVPLGHTERPHWSSTELMAVLEAAATDFDKALLGVLSLMGLRCGEARTLTVGDLVGDQLSVKNGGAGTDTTKTRAGRRTLPVPEVLLPRLQAQAGTRPKHEYLFPSPRKKDQAIGKGYVSDALTRSVAKANLSRTEKIRRINVHGLRHTFAAISLSEAEADLLSVSKAMGHARPSITLDRYGHLAPTGLGPLMAKIDGLVSPGG